MALPRISPSDFQPVPLAAPAISPLSIGQTFIAAMQQTSDIMRQRERDEMLRMEFAQQQQDRQYEISTLRPLKEQAAKLDMLGKQATIASAVTRIKTQEAELEADKAYNNAVAGAFAGIDADLAGLGQAVQPLPEPSTPAVDPSADYPNKLRSDIEAFVKSTGNTPADVVANPGAFSPEILNTATELNRLDAELNQRFEQGADAGGPNPLLPPVSPEEAGTPAPAIEQPAQPAQPAQPQQAKPDILAQIDSLQRKYEAVSKLNRDGKLTPKLTTIALAIEAAKFTPEYQKAVVQRTSATLDASITESIKFAKTGQIADFAATNQGAWRLLQEADAGKELSIPEKQMLQKAINEHASKFDPSKSANQWRPTEQLVSALRDSAEARFTLADADASTEDKRKAGERLAGAITAINANLIADPRAAAYVQQYGQTFGAKPPAVPAAQPAPTKTVPAAPAQPTFVSKFDQADADRKSAAQSDLSVKWSGAKASQAGLFFGDGEMISLASAPPRLQQAALATIKGEKVKTGETETAYFGASDSLSDLGSFEKQKTGSPARALLREKEMDPDEVIADIGGRKVTREQALDLWLKELGQAEKNKPAGFSISANGKTYQFESQQKLDAFKKAAGIQ